MALAAMKKFPKGFPRYKDKEATMSSALNKFFRENNLFPTPNHKIYSFRHTFEDRLKEAGVGNELRRLLMGMQSTVPSTAPAGHWNGGKLNCGKSNWPLIRLSSDPHSDARHAILPGLERLQFRLQALVDRQVHGAFVPTLRDQQHHAIKALLQNCDRDGHRPAAPATRHPHAVSHACASSTRGD
jgi:hypothetical protein